MVLKTIMAVILPVFFLSCSLLEPEMSVLQGNYAYQQGNYQKALLHYLPKENQGNHKERILYNIATVYYALGEGPSALELWQRSELSMDKDVHYASSFNSGVVLYQSGQFTRAYRAFRLALELNPGSLAAKKNLELTLERLEAESRTADNKREPATDNEVSDDARRIMQYIKRKEGSRWKQQESSSDSDQDW